MMITTNAENIKSKTKITALSPQKIKYAQRFDMIYCALCLWILSGALCDTYAHIHQAVDSFFTPWHAVYYTGFLALVSFTGVVLFGNRYLLARKKQNNKFSLQLPIGYEFVLLAFSMFALFGVGDAIWHSFFGFETNLDALMSPTHLGLFISSLVLFYAPIKALKSRNFVDKKLTWQQALPAILSLMAMLTFFKLYTGYGDLYENAQYLTTTVNGNDLLSVPFQVSITTVVLILLARDWKLPFGSYAILFAIPTCLALATRDYGVPLATNISLSITLLLIGIVLDVVITSNIAITIIAASSLQYGVFFAICFITMGSHNIAWTIHIWAGLVVAAGLTSWLCFKVVFSKDAG